MKILIACEESQAVCKAFREKSRYRKNNAHRGFLEVILTEKIISWNSSECAKLRSKTPLGVALAMAEQWGKEI